MQFLAARSLWMIRLPARYSIPLATCIQISSNFLACGSCRNWTQSTTWMECWDQILDELDMRVRHMNLHLPKPLTSTSVIMRGGAWIFCIMLDIIVFTRSDSSYSTCRCIAGSSNRWELSSYRCVHVGAIYSLSNHVQHVIRIFQALPCLSFFLMRWMPWFETSPTCMYHNFFRDKRLANKKLSEVYNKEAAWNFTTLLSLRNDSLKLLTTSSVVSSPTTIVSLSFLRYDSRLPFSMKGMII